MSQIGIVGLGLIGGSLGLDLRASGHHILGISRHAKTCDRALERGIVDQATVEFSRLGGVDVLFLCTPIHAIVPTLAKICPYLRSDTVVTDVASVKTQIVGPARELWPYFLGGHPMAGTQYQGVEAAQAHLFENAPYVLTPEPDDPPALVEAIAPLVQQLNSQLHICTPQDHDRAVARISHLPVMVSASLIHSCQRDAASLALAQQLASSGFRDTSRVGSGNPELGVMMAQYNKTALQAALQDYRDSLDALIAQIDQEDWSGLAATLQASQVARRPFIGE